MDFAIQIDHKLEKDIRRLARRAASVETEIAELIRRGIAAAWGVQAEIIPDVNKELNGSNAFEYAMRWCRSNRMRFIGQTVLVGSNIVGRWNDRDTCVYVYRAIMDELLMTAGYRVLPTLSHWRDAGLIETGHDQLRYTKQVRVIPGKGAERVYALKIPPQKNLNSDE